MIDEELLKRAEDLSRRCERTALVTNTGFLTPAQLYELEAWAKHGTDCTVLFHGGAAENDRKAAFFLPDWIDPETFDPAEHLCALQIDAFFGEPGHRDYMGAVLGLGIGREWLGDILVDGSTAYLFCLPSIKNHLLLNLDKVGRCGVKVKEIPLADVPLKEKKMKLATFSAKSLRLDAVCAGMFSLSRTAAAEAVAAGLVTLNYAPCLKPDAAIRAGDILSLHGKGKGTVLDVGSNLSRKGRLFVKTGIYE